MNTELFIAKRIFSFKELGNLSKPAIRVSIASISLSIAVMIISVAIVTGFQNEIRNKVIGFGAHIQISKFDSNSSLEAKPIDKNQPFYASFKAVPGIRHIQIYATKAGIIKTDDQMEGVVLKGIGSDYDWSFFQNRMIDGTIFKVNDTAKSKDVIISKLLAKRLKFKTGDSLRMYFISSDQTQPRGRKFKISGIYETGLEEFDKVYVIGDIAQIQSLANWNKNQVGGFEVLLNDYNDIDKMSEFVYENIGYDLDSKNIKQLNPQIFDWLKLQDLNVIIILTLMILVSAINIISTLLILILERTNMIGILKVMGVKNISIRRIFLYTSINLIGKGLFWGNIIAITLCLLQKQFGIFTLPQESYYVSVIPINLNIIHIIILNAGTLLICMMLLIIPSYVVTKISPINAIRFD
ncbi:MAG: ABC transporter permease [Bacteroidetes bacterium]|nr:ABC transporter permease [Bacteroidota bacterium]